MRGSELIELVEYRVAVPVPSEAYRDGRECVAGVGGGRALLSRTGAGTTLWDCKKLLLHNDNTV